MSEKRKQIDRACLLQKAHGYDSLNYLSLVEEYEIFFGAQVPIQSGSKSIAPCKFDIKGAIVAV